MKIAVLDNGIYKDALHSKIETYIIGNSVNTEFVQENRDSHATICAKIIEKYSSPDVIIDVVFLGNDGTANAEDLCDALEFCLDYEKIDVINLSNGIEIFDKNSDIYKRIVEVCKRLYEKGVKIFAAQSNNGRITLPSDLPYTISVEQFDRKKIH